MAIFRGSGLGGGGGGVSGSSVSVYFSHSEGGSVLTTGVKKYVRVPFAMTLTGWEITSDVSGSVVVDVWKDTYCVDEDTEALTKRGWRRYSEVTTEDEFLAFNVDSNKTQWEYPSNIFQEDYSGPMLKIGGKNHHFSALVTPNHEWPIIRLHGSKELRLPIERVSSVNIPKKCLLIRSADYSGNNEKYSDAFIKIIAWIFTEGSSRNNHKHISISQSEKENPEFCKEIEKLLIEMGANDSGGDKNLGKTKRVGNRGSTRRDDLWFSTYFKEESHCWSWNLSGKPTDKIMEVFKDKANKILSYEFISELSTRQAKMFVEVALKGDGTKRNGTFNQHNRERMDNFCAIAVLAGYSPSLTDIYTNCALRKKGRYTWYKDVKKEWVHYNGIVWCPTLPSGYWVARRDGKVFITGNSNFPPTVADTIAASAKPTLSGVQKNTDSTLTGWTVALDEGDYLGFNIDSATTVTNVDVYLFGTRD